MAKGQSFAGWRSLDGYGLGMSKNGVILAKIKRSAGPQEVLLLLQKSDGFPDFVHTGLFAIWFLWCVVKVFSPFLQS